mmetsp:Transcript_41653/g.54864  ORF Transcript_41653/g.54864 Transcript_41653/m.54864 type:complete len:117 (+) Transcript_41653:75-425(+)
MLRDRGYEVGDAEIEETFEDFEKRNLTVKSLNMIVTRPIPGRTSLEVTDEHGNPGQMKEPIFVAFAPDEKLGNDAFKSLVGYMHKWSVQNKDVLCNELSNAIVIIKGTTSQVFRKN